MPDVRQTKGGTLLLLLLAALGLGIVGGAWAQEAQRSADLTQMSLEDLLNVPVTTASKKEQRLGQTAAAVYVITAEDIARSGLTSIPEVLRLAPGVEVGQVSSDVWAVSIRGFNGQFSDKLLVLIDGRSVYSEAFSGVFWNIADLLLEDVERIEVIRGPGAAVWGANAVNGVINIITKSASQTQGGLVTASGGSSEQAGAAVRYGSRWHGVDFRVSTKYFERGPWAALSGGSNHDRWDLKHAGFRGDWASSSQKDTVLLEGDLFHSGAATPLSLATLEPPYTTRENTFYSFGGGSVLLRWKHVQAGGVKTTFQAFYDRSQSADRAVLRDREATYDFDFQQERHFWSRHDLVWGVGFRRNDEITTPGTILAFIPNDQTINLFSGFAQDEIRLGTNRLWLTLGSKFEHNSYVGAEIEPNARLLWAPRSQQSLWMAISRAIRNPSTYQKSIQSNLSAGPGPGGLPLLVVLLGNRNFSEEEELAYEAGYRVQLNKRLSLDLAAFYTIYHSLASVEFRTPFLSGSLPLHVELPLLLGNGVNGRGHGGEASVSYTVTPLWKLTGSYSLLRVFLRPSAAHPQATSTDVNNYPEQQLQAHSQFTLPRNLDVDTSVYYFSHLAGAAIPGHTRLDVHLAWSPLERLGLSCGLQNLLDARHMEFVEPNSPQTPAWVPRSFYGKAEWRF